MLGQLSQGVVLPDEVRDRLCRLGDEDPGAAVVEEVGCLVLGEAGGGTPTAEARVMAR
ncbi:hypothetical protein [Streptomyces sp. SID11385]|uniref:hypothetical protein n=1 Tax=Streptomyces sp. SID11385 TaxID=2706031 RepID=UPI001942F051|nr:hypothetical protein [Streptomyces sp. SID11385]